MSPPSSSVSPSLSAREMLRCEGALLELHAALDVDALWSAVLRLLRTAVPSHRVTLFLGHLGMGEARIVRTDPPIAKPTEWYAERGKLNPFTPYIESHRGLRFYRFEQVVKNRREWERSPFFTKFARAEGWNKGFSMVYWQKREVTAMFSLYRAPAERAFSSREERCLHWLYPYIGTAIERVRRLHTERLARRSLEEFNRHLPVGLILIDWNLRVEFTNLEAQRQCLRWNFSDDEARALNPKESFRVPEPIREACAELRTKINTRDPRGSTLLPGDVASVSHPTKRDLRATVSTQDNPSSGLARPRLLVVLDLRPTQANGDAAGGPAKDRFGALRELTPREREIALLVCEGCTNAEIAHRLSKSLLTVKTQLNSVFRKLGLKSRTRLVALFR